MKLKAWIPIDQAEDEPENEDEQGNLRVRMNKETSMSGYCQLRGNSV